jgi:hypothetical protein
MGAVIYSASRRGQVRMSNLCFFLTHFGARYHWGLKNSRVPETWRTGIRLLDDWSYFDRPEPRLASMRWMRHVPMFARVLVIYHFRLGWLKSPPARMNSSPKDRRSFFVASALRPDHSTQLSDTPSP